MRYKKILFWSVVFSFVAMCLLIFFKKPQISSDGTLFASQADHLLRDNFNVFKFLSEAESTSPPLLYMTYITIVALAKLFTGNLWPWSVTIFNALNASIAFYFLGSAGIRAGVRPVIVFFILSMLIICIDFLTWLPFVLTDINFFLIVSIALFALLTFQQTTQWRYLLLSVAVGMLAVLSRPTGVGLFVFIGGIIILTLLQKKKFAAAMQIRNIHIFTVAVIICMVVALAYSWILVEACENRIHSPTLAYLGSLFQEGIVIHDRPSTFVPPGISVIGFFKIIWLRFVGFFYFYFPGHSVTHLLINLLFFGPMYGLNILGLFWWLSGDIKNENQSFGIGTLLALIFTIAFFHACTVIDYDARYRLATIPEMLLVSMIVLENLLSRYQLQLLKFNSKTLHRILVT